VRSALTNVTGVISAEVSMPDKAVVKYTKDKTTPDKMIAAIKKAGYSAEVRKEKEKGAVPKKNS
jgi:copper chaperone CopZ